MERSGKFVKAHIIYKNEAGKRVPGVTTVLGILNKPLLVPWANRIGLQGINVKDYVSDKADIGTLVHEMMFTDLANMKAKMYPDDIINEIIWFKPNAPPNLSCRYFAHAHETLICARKIKKAKHYFDYNSLKEWDDKISNVGKQMKSVWSIPLTPPREKVHGKHPTQKPLELLRRIVVAHSKEGDLILDPFSGSGTTGIAAVELGRRYVGIDKEKDYLELAIKRFKSLSISL